MTVEQAEGGTARRPKAAVVVAHRIAELISAGELQEGDPLPNETAMLADLGVSRPTLREALRLLETQGVLRMKSGPGGGPVVRRPDPGNLAGAMTLLLQGLGAGFGEALVAWAALEPVAAGLAARAATDGQLAALEEQAARMAAASAEPAFYTENARFHALLAEAAGNTVVLVVLEAIARITAGIGAGISVPRSFRGALADQALDLVEALRARDEAAATAVMAATMGDWQRFVASRYPDLRAEPIRWTPVAD
ncbi:FadR/GntR family transcriptional regulator [Trujillonella humicola]|uniref:FadR/GntR family transcriptional regulator n=1 Tax=Trujillonella humicola TaxID=3383699 RepID=UPI003905D4E7